jgi:hypothetical protein
VSPDAEGSVDLYVAILVNEISVDGPGHVPWYEESIVLLRAASDEDAARRALQHARAAETSYANADGETVHWSFREIASIGPALEGVFDPVRLAEGVEIYSRSFGDLDAYRALDGQPDAARWSPDVPD